MTLIKTLPRAIIFILVVPFSAMALIAAPITIAPLVITTTALALLLSAII